MNEKSTKLDTQTLFERINDKLDLVPIVEKVLEIHCTTGSVGKK